MRAAIEGAFMRILYSHRIQSRDGQSVHVEEMIAALRAAGAEVVVVGPGFYEQSGFGGESRLVALARRLLPAALAELAELAYNVPAYRRLRRAARGFRPDIIYERYNLFYLAGAALARREGIPFFLEINAPLAEERARFGGLRLGRLARWAERHVWRAAARVFAVTGVLGEMVARDGVARERLVITPNGIDLAAFPEPHAGARGGETLVLGFTGFVRDWHGLDAVIAALAGADADPRLRLVIAGDGPARPQLERQAAALGLAARVRFTGLVGRAEIPALVTDFDIALQPRVVAYASPLKIFEYMAAGRAIVAPDQPNIREILDHERSALLFDPNQAGAMWAAITRLAGDPDLRARLGAEARADIIRRDYTWAGNARRVLAHAGAATKG
jgi:glycosyltransferase involved in cell wall biosynthesis